MIDNRTRRPLIGITVDRIEKNEPTDASYSVRCNYVEALSDTGAQSILLPFDPDAISLYANLCDGFLVTGSHPGEIGSLKRQAFDRALIRTALEEEIPLLGICNGMQMIGLALGGELLPATDEGPDKTINHNPEPIPNSPAHPIVPTPDTRLAHMALGGGTSEILVNSLHKQALAHTGNFHVAATAPDGIVEALEVPGHPFAMGVQWHPEYRLTAFDRTILTCFVSACFKRKESHPCPKH
ncbi:gamma-glutamyl-gamma-aminobutyrate hydrolase family protein [Aestuariispira ectoiniformans]|uniref:gamma-glutamyl-gamma-aminobutyrate hydrolase family protein n=1 Tax=Aestuariispira ectoiniformans TaxID=2775080 RepID=UPI0021B07741|nr:gamma-glutamyl-gamma-aminobutyrate hydrolase family protein [Aestuariispira ectoiniformans]